MSTRTYEEKVRIHEQVRRMYDLKIGPLPATLFLGRRKPTLQDIINGTTWCIFVGGIPEEYDLSWYFLNYNDLAKFGFKARKSTDDEEKNLSRAIWYLGIDAKHSLSYKLEHSRLNMLCMLIAFALPGVDQVFEHEATSSFRGSYRMAWEQAIKHSSEEKDTRAQDYFLSSWNNNVWDVIIWKSGQRGVMKGAVEKLQKAVPPMPFAPKDFWKEADEQPVELRQKLVTLWAMRWLIHMDKEGKIAHQRTEDFLMSDERHQSEMADGIASMAGDIDELSYLDDPRIFHRLDLFNALMTPVEDDIQPLPPQEHTPWMDPSVAIDLVQGKLVNINGLVDAMSSMGM
ncbi:uncharacterized protein N0V89_010118 [Didymosphaeria variabile]|uniref:Uncharacterized protein n=1 Tax=Didymosphaeria variabile TaxID=1932322 RepID=A0A9W8XF88_9PLEO|nr:uncharacterized protein N0V89_010118 [Didymosphaeria variabile]KAJ4348740.1 hypothetical protein N0V89_010118 [Didymosphaeria variabile]